MTTIVDIFEAQVEKAPSRIAVSYDEFHFSYDFINNKSNELANIFLKSNIKIQEPVAVILERDVNAIIGLYAILKCGGTYSPIEPGLPIKRIVQLINCLSAEIIICNPSILLKLNESLYINNENKYQFYCVKDESDSEICNTVQKVQNFSSSANSSANNPTVNNSPDNFAYIIYTSGSTGLPKGVTVKHRPVINLIEWVNKTYHVNEEDKILCISSLSFDLSVYDIFGLLSTGGCVRMVPSKHLKDPLKLLNIIIKEGITFWDSAPAALLQLVPYFDTLNSKKFISSLRLVFLSGDWIPLSISDKMKQVFNKVQVIGLGGATEATIWSNYYNINKIDKAWKSIPYGRPISNAKYYILTDNLQICPIGTPGNLYIGGKCLATGYVNDIDTSFKKFIKNPFNKDEIIYCTGDMARWYEDGNIEFLGRKDNQVKIRGHRIELGEINYYLNKHPKIDEVVSDVKINHANDKVICTYYISKEKLISVDLANYIKEYVPHYMIPDFFMPLESIPITSNGKLDRELLQEPSIQLNNNIISPRNETEIAIHEIWQRVLKLKEYELGVNSNFFELGGHSLKITEVIAEILDIYKKHVPVQEFMVNPTIENLANYVNDSAQTRISKIKPAEKKKYYILSQSQTRFYVLQQLVKSNSYNISISFELIGKTDFTRLEKVMYQLICRHESLRTCFKMIDGKPYQFISDPKPISFDYFMADSKDEIGEIIAKYPKVYDLGNLFLFGVGCIKISTENTILIFDIHHIISDAISLNLLIHEFIQLYNESILPENTIQYKDFSEWSVNKTHLDSIKKQELYWMEQFKEEVPEIRLYHDKIRPRRKSFKGKNHTIKLPDTVLKQLQEFAHNNEVTLNVLLFTYFNILISKISGITDINIGTVVSGRRRSEIMNSIGVFVNTLVLRNYPTFSKSFKEFLQEVKENTFNALENQDYQFEALIEKLGVERNTDRNPLFEIMYVYNDQNENKQGGNDSNVKFYPPDYPIAKFDLTLEIWITEKIDLTFNYCTDIFNDQTIEKISNQYKKVIFDTIATPECLLNEIEIINTDEKKSLLNDFSGIKLDIPNKLTVLEMFEQNVKKYPDKIAIAEDERFITYRELGEKADCIAFELLNNNVQQKEIVAVLLPRSIDLFASFIAILKLGAVYLPIDINNPKKRIDYYVNHVSVKTIITSEVFSNKVTDSVQKIDVGKIKDRELNKTFSTQVSEQHPLYVIFTSGTTGNPKAVLVENRGFVNLIYNYFDIFKLEHNFILSQVASPGFDAMAFELWPSLTRGASLYLIPEKIKIDPNLLKEWIVKKNISISYQPTAMVENLIKHDWGFDSLSFKTLITAGDKLNHFPSSKIPFELYNLYGPTEDSVWTTFKKVEVRDEYTETPSIGRPIANKTVYILGENQELLPIGVPGELYINGRGLGRGYLNNPNLNQDKFLQNPYGKGLIYRTGDIAKWLPTGEIEFIGRNDSQVKIRGYRIELGDVSQQIQQHESVDKCVVLTQNSNDKEKYLVAYYTSKSNIENVELKNDIKKRLPNYMLPSFFIKINKFKVNINGKIDTKSLPDAKSISSDKLDLPTGILENKLLNIWKEVLNLDKIGVGHNFFDIGGNSLKLIEVNEKVHELLEIKTNVIDLIQYPTIRELSQFLKNSDPSNEVADSELISRIDAGKSKMKDLKFKK